MNYNYRYGKGRLHLSRKRRKPRHLLELNKRIKAIKTAARAAREEAASTEVGETSTEAGTSSAEARLTSTEAETDSAEARLTSTEAETASVEARLTGTESGAVNAEAGTVIIEERAVSTEAEETSVEAGTASREASSASVQASRKIQSVPFKQSLSIKGRRIVDVNYFFKQLQKLNKHSRFGCNLNDMIIVSEKKVDFLSSLTFRCKLCDFQEDVWTEEESVNSDTLNGLLNSGCGYSNWQKLFTMLQLPISSTFERRYRLRLREEMKEAKKQELIIEKEMEKAKMKELKEAEKKEIKAAKELERARMKEAKKQEMMAQKRKPEAFIFGSNEIDPPVLQIGNVKEASELSVKHPSEAVGVPEIGEPLNKRINTEEVIVPDQGIQSNEVPATHHMHSFVPGQGIQPTGETAMQQVQNFVPRQGMQPTVVAAMQKVQNFVPGQGMQPTAVAAIQQVQNFVPGQGIQTTGITAIEKMQNLVNIIGGASSRTQCRLSQVSEYSAPYIASSSLAPAKTFEQRDMVGAVTSESFAQMPINLPIQSPLPAHIHSCLKTLKARMLEKKQAADVVVKVAKQIPHLIKLQASAKFQKEHELKTLEGATAREKAVRLNDAGERMFISDLKNQALSGIQRASSMEKYAEEELNQATNKLLVALETLVATIAREEQALIELEKALANSETRQTDPKTFVKNTCPEESTTKELDVEQEKKPVIACDVISVNEEPKDKQGTLETENNTESTVVIKEEIEIDDDYSVEGGLT